MSAWQIGAEATGTEDLVRRAKTPARAAGDPATSAKASGSGLEKLQGFFDRLTKWIPAETLALYIPGVTWFGGGNTPQTPSWGWLVTMIMLTPALVILSAFAAGPVTRRVYVAAGLGVLAFAIWSASVPMSGWQRLGFVAQNQMAVAVGAAIAGILFHYLAEGILRRIPGAT